MLVVIVLYAMLLPLVAGSPAIRTSIRVAVPPNTSLSGSNATLSPVTDDYRPENSRRVMFKRSLPACAQTNIRAKTFLIIFMGHSGSSAILSELRTHPEVHLEGPEPVDHGIYSNNTDLALNYTRTFFDNAIANMKGKVPGFKIRPYHIRKDPAAWAQLAREYGTRIIWQYRLNALKQAVGEYSYRYFHDNSIIEGLRSAEEVKERCNTGIGCSFAIKDMQFFHAIITNIIGGDFTINEATSLMADGSDCIHELRYEDYLYHREGSLYDLFEFLGLSQVKTKPLRFKATKDNLCEVVENWDELCRTFYGCAVWRHLFEDEINGCGCRFTGSPRLYCSTTLPPRRPVRPVVE